MPGHSLATTRPNDDVAEGNLMRRRLIPAVSPKRLRPMAAVFPAEQGWRVIWYEYVKPADPGVALIKPTIAIEVSEITHWGLEAPTIKPGDPKGKNPVVEWNLEGLIPLIGEIGSRLPQGAYFFELIDVWDRRTEQQLKEYCHHWFDARDGLTNT